MSGDGLDRDGSFDERSFTPMFGHFDGPFAATPVSAVSARSCVDMASRGVMGGDVAAGRRLLVAWVIGETMLVVDARPFPAVAS